MLSLLVGATQNETLRAQPDVVRDERAVDAVAPAELLDHERGRKAVEPEPAVLLGDREAEEPRLAHLLKDARRNLPGLLDLLLRRDQLLLDEVPRLVLQRLGVLGNLKFHDHLRSEE